MSQFIISPISARRNKSKTFVGSSFVAAAFPGTSISDNNNNLNKNNLSTNNNESKFSSFDTGIINQGAVNHQHRLYQHINSKPQDGKPVLRMDNFFKPILNIRGEVTTGNMAQMERSVCVWPCHTNENIFSTHLTPLFNPKAEAS